jgi:selenocysteine lyase/cysteine desulfurase
MFHDGQMNDVRDICDRFRPKCVEVLVDITQHVGVAPIDLRAWNVSAAAFGCHKGLGCPTGLGMLYITPSTLPSLKRTPPMVGAGAIANLPSTLLADPTVEYHTTSQRYEHLNICLVATTALSASLDFLLHDVGIGRLENHLRALGLDLTSRCKSIGVDVVESLIAEQRAPHLDVLKLKDPGWKGWFEAEKIYVSRYRDGVRVSLGLYNNLSDIKTLIASIERGLEGELPRC